ncbi:MAG: response regulator [Candidatus Hydrothermarchaeales archaeon]
MTRRILVADDEPRALQGLSRILSNEGYHVTGVGSGREAINKVKVGSFDILLTDVKMPDIDGMEVLERVKKISPKTCVVMITGFATIDNAVEAMRKGAKDYIRKPFRPDELINCIKRALEERNFEEKKDTIKAEYSLSRSELDSLIDALANPIRRDVIELLYEEERSTYTNIANELGIKDPTLLSFHLRKLKSAGVIDQDEGKIYLLTMRGEDAARMLKRLKMGGRFNRN